MMRGKRGMVYKAGIVGCGRIGSEFDDDQKRKYIATHAGAYSAVPETELVAVADINREKVEKCGKKWNARSLYQNYEEMLEKENLDILSICTWNSTHLEIVKKAVEYDVKAIFCEKPIADTLSNAYQMIEICNKNNVILQIDHQRRFCKFHQEVRNFLIGGELGKIQQVSFYYTAGIANTGSHMFDLLRFFFDDVEWVIAFQSENKFPNEEDPNFDGLLRFKNNVFCSIHACDVKNFLIFEMDIVGEKGRLRITHSGFDLDFYEIKDSNLFSGYKELYRCEPPIDKDSPRDFMINGVNHLVECLENSKQSISSGEDSLRALELICAFHESAKEDGKKMYLPLKESNIQIKSR
ncbi:MAG: Gfo/Idh/MocA family oxidoreductase [Halobacteriota archaeon]